MARYDYGLRGPHETMEPRSGRWPGEFRDWRDDPRPLRRGPPQPRVIARYNLDYVVERGPRYPRNPHPFGGDWYDQIGDERAYRQPFLTRGGTWTNRGAPPPPFRYDYRDYGPDYGGRYPDEL